MSEKDDGGPAFPNFHPEFQVDLGMSLRDWMAGQVITSCIERMAEEAAVDGKRTYESVIRASSQMAYAVADAMLEARQQ